MPTNDLVTQSRNVSRLQNRLLKGCNESLDVFSPADLHVEYPPSPITIYAAKHEVEQNKDRLDFINITKIGEAQAMMEMVRHEYIGNLQYVSTDIMRMYMDPEFWYQQHNFDSDTHHLNNHMIDMVQKYMRGDATRMENVHRSWCCCVRIQTLQGNFFQEQINYGSYSIYAC